MRKMILALTALLCLLPLGTPAHQALAAKKTDKSDFNGIKAMSFNIRTANAKDGTNSWEYRADAVLAMIQDQAPDVLGLQEALLRQVQPLIYFLGDFFIQMFRGTRPVTMEYFIPLHNSLALIAETFNAQNKAWHVLLIYLMNLDRSLWVPETIVVLGGILNYTLAIRVILTRKKAFPSMTENGKSYTEFSWTPCSPVR